MGAHELLFDLPRGPCCTFFAPLIAGPGGACGRELINEGRNKAIAETFTRRRNPAGRFWTQIVLARTLLEDRSDDARRSFSCDRTSSLDGVAALRGRVIRDSRVSGRG
jgi:hypothetical protein